MPNVAVTYWMFLLAVLLFAGCGAGVESLPSDASRSPDSPDLVVAVVGAGVAGTRAPGNRASSPDLESLNSDQGWAMWSGSIAAYNESPSVPNLRQLFELLPFDDDGTEQGAIDCAKKLQTNPRVIAVIGHASSGATKAAASYYAEAGIPLLMPIATSPNVMSSSTGPLGKATRLRNCYRLPPCDVKGQAKAVAWLVQEHLKANRPYLIVDESRDASIYSHPLAEAVADHLPIGGAMQRTVDRKSGSLRDAVAGVKSHRPDTIVFCGYGSMAQEFLDALRVVYAETTPKENRPTVLLTDGCKIPDLNVEGFDTYLTFPLPTVKDITTETPDLKLLKAAVTRDPAESYQMYGYDAVLTLGQAMRECQRDGGITRANLLAKLASNSFTGASLSYRFEDGDNYLSSYYVFTCSFDSSTSRTTYTFFRDISHSELTSMMPIRRREVE